MNNEWIKNRKILQTTCRINSLPSLSWPKAVRADRTLTNEFPTILNKDYLIVLISHYTLVFYRPVLCADISSRSSVMESCTYGFPCRTSQISPETMVSNGLSLSNISVSLM